MMVSKSLFCSLVATLSALTAAQASVGSSQDYGQVQDYLMGLARLHPENASLFELGLNSQGQTIVGLKIGNGPIKNLVVGTHHGNEYGSTEVALGASAELAKFPIKDRTIFVIPVLNISGFTARARREAVGASGSLTADPNRDYPSPCATEGPFHLKSTQALAEFIDREEIVSLLTLHTSGGMVLYPWGISTKDTSTLYDREFKELGGMCSIASGYRIGNSTDMLYPADGAFEDYAFWKHGIWSILIEIGRNHSPTERELAELVKINVPGIRKFMESAPTQRALDHEFRGRCDLSFISLDRHDER